MVDGHAREAGLSGTTMWGPFRLNVDRRSSTPAAVMVARLLSSMNVSGASAPLDRHVMLSTSQNTVKIDLISRIVIKQNTDCHRIDDFSQ